MARRSSKQSARRRKHTRRSRFGSLRFEPLEPRLVLQGGPVISEFMAINQETLLDGDGVSSDWIELYNPGDTPIDLSGGTDPGSPRWMLRDGANQWSFPKPGEIPAQYEHLLTLEPGEYQVLMASSNGGDYTQGGYYIDSLGYLHTNFALDGDNPEYLGLIQPDGTVAHEYAPTYPVQFADVSYGVSQEGLALVGEGKTARYLVPTANEAGEDWTSPTYDDSAWQQDVLINANFDGGEQGFLYVDDPFDTNLPYKASGSYDPSGGFRGGGLMVYLPQFAYGQASGGWSYTFDVNQAGSHEIAFYYRLSTGPDYDVGELSEVIVQVDDASHRQVVFQQEGDGDGGAIGDTNWQTATVQMDLTAGPHTLTIGVRHQSNSSGEWSQFWMDEVVVRGGEFAGGEGRTALGYDTAGSGTAGFDVTTYKANVTVDSLAAAEQVISDPAKQSWTANRTGVAVIDYENTDTPGHFAYWVEDADKSFPGTTWNVNNDDLVIEATTQVIIPTAGQWTFGVHSDEGFSLELTKGALNYSFSYPDTRTAADSLETFDIAEAGIYDVRLVYFERGFASGVELFAAEGSYTVFTPGVFHLVGDAARGGLSTGGFNGVIQTDVSGLMLDQNATIWVRLPFQVTDPAGFDSMTLRVRYNDAFVAYLNGVEIARSTNAPDPLEWNSQATSARSAEESVAFETFGATASLSALQPGTNVLAVHGLNLSPDDSNFLLSPELYVSREGGFTRYFSVPSPGGPNLASFADYVAPLQFSLPHGIYDTLPAGQYYDLTITTETPDALIYYTLDGTEPSPTNGILYGAPLQLNQTTVVRAVAYKEGYEPTDIVTQTYLFPGDVIYQSPDGSPPPGDWPSGSVNGQLINYGMDPDIVNPDPQGVIDALKAIPSISMVTDLDYLFDPTIGIFVNARKDAGDADPWEDAVRNWERPASIELIYPDGATGPGFPDGADEGFQVEAGVRIRGGYSRQDGNPKHAFRLFFREAYGDAKLRYPLFGDEGADQFDAVDLATSQNYSWAFGGPNNNTMIRDMIIRDLQGIMGNPYTRSRFYACTGASTTPRNAPRPTMRHPTWADRKRTTTPSIRTTAA